MKWLIITKKSAARSQLEVAIQLWFDEGDPVATHTLAAAADDCLHAIGSAVGKPSIFKTWLKSQSKRFQERATDAQNFFKHGFRDLRRQLPYSLIHAEILIFDSTVCYRQVFGQLTPLMTLFAFRFAIENPEAVLPEHRPLFLKEIEVYKFGESSRHEFYDEFLPLISAGRPP